MGKMTSRPPRRPSPNRTFVEAVPTVTAVDASGVAASRTAGGVVATYKARATWEADVEAQRLLRDVEDGRRELSAAHERLRAARAEAVEKHLEVQALEAERAVAAAKVAALRDDTAMPAAERLARVARLKAQLELSDRALAAEQRRIAVVDKELAREEHATVGMEVALQKKIERLDAAHAADDARVARQRGAAAARVEAEGKSADNLLRAMSNREADMARRDEAAALAATQTQARTDELSGAARQRLASNQAQSAAIVAAARRAGTEALVGRANAVLSLRANLDNMSSETRAANSRRAAAAERKAADQRAEYSSLLEQGFNPYEVWRARERDVKVQRAIEEHEFAVAAARLEVTKKVVDEDFKSRYLDAEARAERDVQEEYKRSISRTVREANLSAYIMDKTIGHTDTMDPSGREFRVEPSQVTVVRPSGFGLGKIGLTRPDIVAKIAAKPDNRGVGPLAHWVPEELEPDGDEDGGGRAHFGDAPPQARADDNEGLDLETEPQQQSRSDSSGGVAPPPVPRPRKKYVLRQQSVYEKRLMAQARERQRANVTSKQIVLGREYKGVGFLPAPAALHFKDFTVGEPFEIKFTLTNVSLTFNSFKVLPLPDEIRDLFTISFSPPGRMSAGLTLPMSITFIPRQNVDIRSSLQLLAQTGPVSIPLLCTTKKALPIVRQPVLDLGDVTLGEQNSGHFVIENEGALPLSCLVMRASYGIASGGELSDLSGGESSPGASGSPGGSDGEGSMAGARHRRRVPRGPTDAIEEDALSEAVAVQERVDLPGYGSARILTQFAPKASGIVHLPLELSFYELSDGPDAPSTLSSAKPVQLLVKASGTDVPLFVERDSIDLRTCLAGKLYRGTLVVLNRGNVALRCSPDVHPGLARGPEAPADAEGGPDANSSFMSSVSEDDGSLLGASRRPKAAGTGGTKLSEPALVFHPNTGFVQAADPVTGVPGRFEFSIKFRPTADLPDRPELQDCRVYDDSGSPDGQSGSPNDSMDGTATDDTALALAPLIDVPMLIWAPDQVLPVPFSLRARIASPEVTFEPEALDFGKCLLGQAISLPLTIFNRSALPQKFGFVRLPSCFSVDPGTGNGFGLLLPGESCTANVVFSPFTAEEVGAQLQCRTTANGRFYLDVRGTGVRGPVALSHPVLFLAATAVGETETAFVHLSNTSGAAIDFEILQPPPAGPQRACPLSVLPSVGRIEARETCRLVVQFSPSQGDLDFGLAAQAAVPGAVARARLALESGSGAPTSPSATVRSGTPPIVESAPPAVHSTWQLPIYTRPVPPQALLDGVAGVGLAPGSRAALAQQQSQLERAEMAAVASESPASQSLTPLVQSGVILQVSATAIPLVMSASRRTVSFGQVPVGYTRQEMVRVTNHSDVPLELVPSPFAAAAAFSLTNAPRLLAPGTYHDLGIAFAPTGHKIFTDRLVLGARGHGPTLDVVVSGVGVSPHVAIEPPGAGVVDFGAVCAGDACVRTLSLHNISAFPLSFAARQVRATPALWAPTPVMPFSCDPLEGSIPPSGRVQLTVCFAPRHAPAGGLAQSAAFVIDVPNQDKDAVQTLYLQGRCFDRAAYALPALVSEEISEATPSAVDSALVVGDPTAVADAEGQELITLVFPSRSPSAAIGGGDAASAASAATEGSAAVKELVVTCINRSEHRSATAQGSVQPPSTFAVRMPPALVRRGGSGRERPHFFSVEPREGAVAAGERATLRFKFEPPTEASHEGGPPRAGALPGPLSVGEWQSLDCEVTLGGGYVVPGAPATKSLIVRLRGYVPATAVPNASSK